MNAYDWGTRGLSDGKRMTTIFQLAMRHTMGPHAPSPHELVNQSVAPLHVICTGQENGRLYFEKLSGASNDNKTLVRNIVQAITNFDGLLEKLQSVKTISLESTLRQSEV